MGGRKNEKAIQARNAWGSSGIVIRAEDGDQEQNHSSTHDGVIGAENAKDLERPTHLLTVHPKNPRGRSRAEGCTTTNSTTSEKTSGGERPLLPTPVSWGALWRYVMVAHLEAFGTEI